jgi:LytS/YehU family sensor histidine kinase
VLGQQYDLKVAPLLLIAFIENAFKHGSKDKALRPYIEINLDLSGTDQIRFTVENTIDPGYISAKQGGVGLANVKKQLELLYPGKHTLTIHQTQTHYRVDLTLFLT